MKRAGKPGRTVIALDLGGTKLAAAVCSQTGLLSHKSVVALNGRTGRQVGGLIVEQVQRLRRDASAEGLAVAGLGISVPGLYDSKAGTVWAPNIPGWTKYSLAAQLRQAVRNPAMPVMINDDRACSILGEAWLGAAKGVGNAVFVAVGTGIGAGILINGHVLRGAHGTAGSIGWLALDRPFRAKYVPCGCFEYHASGEGLARVAREFNWSRRETIAAADIIAGYASGKIAPTRVIRKAIEFWGMAVANLVTLLDPEAIIFGGGVFGPAKRFLPRITAEARKWAQPVAMRRVKVLASKLGTDAALVGAARLALGLRVTGSV